MKKELLLLLAVSSTCFSLPIAERSQEKDDSRQNILVIDEIMSNIGIRHATMEPIIQPYNAIHDMLFKESDSLSPNVINKVLTTLSCADKKNIEHNHILTIIDYSLPSSEKRLWVFDLNSKQLLFHTYVSHGIKSGTLLTNNFSNKYNSKASSIGVYTTEKTYYGRDGLSLRLEGLESGFNDNASNRSVVMHGGWYVEENFIKKYGRAGRSWGCPALPLDLYQPIINTIKDKSLFVVYYPSDNWFAKSKYLNCHHESQPQEIINPQIAVKPLEKDTELRDDVLLANLNQHRKNEENEAVVVVTADNYERIFKTKAPLERMLRRQINQTEYIALSNTEFKNIIVANSVIPGINHMLDDVYFVIPVIKMVRGYYETQMKIVNLGKIKEVTMNSSSSKTLGQINSYVVHFENKPVLQLRTTNRFIRWLGL